MWFLDWEVVVVLFVVGVINMVMIVMVSVVFYVGYCDVVEIEIVYWMLMLLFGLVVVICFFVLLMSVGILSFVVGMMVG